jgi:DNA topoisomerase-3
MTKLLDTGKTDLLEGFISMRTRRPFKAFLAWDKEAGKVSFEFAPLKFPGRKKPYRAAPARQVGAARRKPALRASKVGAAARPARAERTQSAPKKIRKLGPGLKPSHELAAVIGEEPVARTEVIKKLWVYIKANALQDAVNKRAINADERLLPVFGKSQVSMFEIAGLVGKHLT